MKENILKLMTNIFWLFCLIFLFYFVVASCVWQIRNPCANEMTECVVQATGFKPQQSVSCITYMKHVLKFEQMSQFQIKE